jgi:hypothetical protein
MLRLSRAVFTVLFIGLLSTLSSCSRERAKGNLEIRVKDHRAAIDDFSKLDVSIDAILLKPSGSWIELKPAQESFDLTAYTKGRFVTVFKGEIDGGPFEGIHLKLGKIAGVRKKNGAEVEVKNGVGPIQVSLSLESKVTTLLVLDLKVLDLSDHVGRGYELHPDAYEIYRDGKLVDKIPPG